MFLKRLCPLVAAIAASAYVDAIAAPSHAANFQQTKPPIVGTAKADVLKGTNSNDVIYGKAGDDTIYGLRGNDRIYGGPGADRIFCGPGKDTVFADNTDTLKGCEKVLGLPKPTPPPPPPPVYCDGKAATIVGTTWDDVLVGTPGDDVIAGLGGDDVIEGLGGNDTLCGNEGDDRIDGGDGTDVIESDIGFDTCVNGESGEDCSAPPAITFVESFPATERTIVQQALSFALQDLREKTGVRVDGITVAVEESDPNDRTGYTTYDGHIRIFAHGRAWTWANNPLYFKYVLVAHEYFHLIQAGLAVKRPYVTDKWIREGSAEIAGYLVSSDAGFISWAQAVSQKKAVARGEAGSLPGCAWPCEYNLGFAAAEYLLENRGGWAAIVAFWKTIGGNGMWQDAFPTAFGESIDAFYAEFEAYRKTF